MKLKTFLGLLASVLFFVAAVKGIVVFLEKLGSTPSKKYITIFDDDTDAF